VFVGIFGNHYLNRQKHTESYIQTLSPRISESLERSTVEPRKQLAFNVVTENRTPERVFDVAVQAKIHIVDKPDGNSDKAIIELYERQQDVFNQEYKNGKINSKPEMGTKENIWVTRYTGILSENQCGGLFNGLTRIYGRMDTSFNCTWLQQLQRKNTNAYTSEDLVWRICTAVNGN
jgi:hypothetical protein